MTNIRRGIELTDVLEEKVTLLTYGNEVMLLDKDLETIFIFNETHYSALQQLCSHLEKAGINNDKVE